MSASQNLLRSSSAGIFIGRIGRKPTLSAGWLVNHQGLWGKFGSSSRQESSSLFRRAAERQPAASSSKPPPRTTRGKSFFGQATASRQETTPLPLRRS